MLWKTAWRGRTPVNQMPFIENFQVPPPQQFYAATAGTGLLGTLNTGWWVGIAFRLETVNNFGVLARGEGAGPGFVGWRISLDPGGIVTGRINNGTDPIQTSSVSLATALIAPGVTDPVGRIYTAFLRYTVGAPGAGAFFLNGTVGPAMAFPTAVWPAPAGRTMQFGSGEVTRVAIHVLQGSNTDDGALIAGTYAPTMKADNGLFVDGAQSNRWRATDVFPNAPTPWPDVLAGVDLAYTAAVPPRENLYNVLYAATWAF